VPFAHGLTLINAEPTSLRRVVVVGVLSVEEFFGVPVGVGAGLAAFEVGWGDPFGAPMPTNYLRSKGVIEAG
jgi:hypothetical protein